MKDESHFLQGQVFISWDVETNGFNDECYKEEIIKLKKDITFHFNPCLGGASPEGFDEIRFILQLYGEIKPIIINIIACFLYDKFKDITGARLRINNNEVEIEKECLKRILKKELENKSYND